MKKLEKKAFFPTISVTIKCADPTTREILKKAILASVKDYSELQEIRTREWHCNEESLLPSQFILELDLPEL